MNTRLLSLALLASAALAACGGGGSSAPAEAAAEPADQVPVSAMASPAALMKYTRAMQATSSDSAEPLSMPEAAMPVSDTSEPETLD